MSKTPQRLLIIPRLQVEQANCISGPLTWGFPAITAFSGFIHALNRKLPEAVTLDGTGVICHHFDPLVYHSRYEYRFCLTRNPIYDREVTKPSGTIEEGKAHMIVTLIAGVYGDIPADFTEMVARHVASMRLAGGSIRTDGKQILPTLHDLSGYKESDEKIFQKLRRKFVPGFALTDRSEILIKHFDTMRQDQPDATLLDALLDLSALKHSPVPPEPDDTAEKKKAAWKTYREGDGWLVPLPVGYLAISPEYQPGEVSGTRDNSTPFRFAETAYSLGEWVNPLKLNTPEDILWWHDANPEQGTYLCRQKAIY